MAQNSSGVGGGCLSSSAVAPNATTTAGISGSSPGSDSADPSDDANQNLYQIIGSIDITLGLLDQLFVTVSSFAVASQLPLLHCLHAFIVELGTMQKMAEICNIKVPLEVVNLIDDGKNPDLFFRDLLNSCIAKNQITKGKVDVFESLRMHLFEELKEAFPDSGNL